MAETIDSLMATLIGMGFEFEDCQEAIKIGKMSAASAVEWILAGKPADRLMTSGSGPVRPTLNLKKNQRREESADASNAFNAPLPIDRDAMDTVECVGQSQDDIKAVDTPEIHSRYAATRDEREKFLEKKRQKFADEVKHFKAIEKQAKNLVLQEIEADRQARWSMSSHAKSDGQTKSKEGVEAKAISTSLQGPSKSDTCTIQFRLPNGTSVRHSFSNDATLFELVNFIERRSPSLTNRPLTFIQPFPRMEFNPASSSGTVEQLGLVPSSNLVVQVTSEQRNETVPSTEPNAVPVQHDLNRVIERPRPLQPELSDQDVATEELRRAVNVRVPNDIQNVLMRPPPGQEYSAEHATPQHNWPSGGGHHLLDENEEGNAEDNPNQEMDQERVQVQPQVFASVVGNVPPRSHFWGSGHALGEPTEPTVESSAEPQRTEEVQPADEQEEIMALEDNAMELGVAGEPEIYHPVLGLGARLGFSDDSNRGQLSMSPTDRRNRAAQAREVSLQQPRLPDVQGGTSRNSDNDQASKTQDLSLTTMCMQAVISRIGAPGRLALTSVGNLPQQLTHRFLQHLCKCKNLTPKTVHLFRSSPVSILNLDYYIYATNQLLKSLQVFPNLQHLSLRGATLFTDAGLKSVSSMLKLKSLNLEGCSQVSDDGIKHLHGLSHLSSLILSETHVTDAGLVSYLQKRSNPENLVRLCLAKVTNITNMSLQHLDCVGNLVLLDLSRTKITRLDLIASKTPKLKDLNVAGCGIPVEQFAHLQSFRDTLVSLNITDVRTGQAEDGDAVLCNLSGLSNLQNLEMQFRATLTHRGIESISHSPIARLDLSSHPLIDDRALPFIAQMQNLQQLNLSNSHISGNSLHLLAPALEHLVELLLQHTDIDSEALISLFKAYNEPASELISLNLAFTKVGNGILTRGMLSTRCPSLVELNLSGTKVSDTGMRHLKLTYLSRLLLDGTRVRNLRSSDAFPLCPSLTIVRAENRQPASSTVDDYSDPET